MESGFVPMQMDFESNEDFLKRRLKYRRDISKAQLADEEAERSLEGLDEKEFE